MSILRKILSVFPVTVLLTIGWPPVTQVAAGGLTHGVFHTPVGIDGPGLLRLGTTYETKNTLHPAESHLSPAFMYAESNDLFVGTPPGGIDKGISWAGIGGGVRIGGPGPRVVGPGAAGATVSGILRAEGSHVGASACGAGRAVRGTEAAGVWRESDGGVR